MNNYDVIIIGAGPAGMTAGIYAARAGMKVLVLESKGPGGQVALTNTIQNYPGVGEIDGFTLGQNMWEQMTSLGVETKFSMVDKIDFESTPKKVWAEGQTYEAPALILSMGAASKGLGLAREKKFIGKGISYCAVCDGMLYKNKRVAVIGGGNSAVEDAVYLSNIVSNLTVVHRRGQFRATEAEVNKLMKRKEEMGDKLELKLGFVVADILGEDKVNGIVIRNTQTNQQETIEVDGVFIAIGRSPQTELLDGKIVIDEKGYIMVDENMRTNIPGVFAAGDVVHKNLRQIATAISDGAIAGTEASAFAKGNK